MKKAYNKPEILFESFTASNNIAANCTTIIDTQFEGGCAYSVVVGKVLKHIFIDGIAACKVNDGEDGNVDEIYHGLCYHAPVEYNTLFNS